jgi:hypothetical protein
MTETLHHALRAMMQFLVIFFDWYSITKQIIYNNKFIPYIFSSASNLNI